MARIRNQRRTRVAYQCDRFPAFQNVKYLSSARGFVVLVATDEPLANLIMVKEFLGFARIFTRNDAYFFTENTQSAESDVFEIPDRCRDQIESGGQTLEVYRRTNKYDFSRDAEARRPIPSG